MSKYFVLFFLLCFNLYFYSQSAVDYYKEGKDFVFSEKYEDAVISFNKALSLNPNFVDVLLDLARLYFDIENYEYSNNYITKALKLTSLNDDLITFSADVDTKLKKYEISEEKYKKILSKNPLNIAAANGLANLYLELDKKIQSKKLLDDVLKTESSNFRAISMMAKYYESFDTIKLEKFYLTNVEKNSLNPESYFEYSVFKFKNKNIVSAIDNIKIAIKMKDSIKYSKYFGKYNLYLNSPDNSISIFRSILEKHDINYLNYYHLACAYYLVSDFNMARLSLKKAISLRDDDEISSYFLDQILINNFEVDDQQRKTRALYYFNKALKAKKESIFDLYIFNLKEAVRVYPKIIEARLELANYYKSINLHERYLRELKTAQKYTDDVNLKDKVEMQEGAVSYKLGDDWDVNQYNINSDFYSIPLFVSGDISNPHFNFDKIYGRILTFNSYEKSKFNLLIFDDKDYSSSEKIVIANSKDSPFYVDLYANEGVNSVDVTARLINSTNNRIIKEIKTFHVGNDRVVLTSNVILNEINLYVPFLSRILKITNNKAIINAGRKSGVRLKDQFLILKNKKYQIQPERAKFVYDKEDVKGRGFVTKLDENIAEIKFKDKDYFKEIDIDDKLIYLSE